MVLNAILTLFYSIVWLLSKIYVFPQPLPESCTPQQEPKVFTVRYYLTVVSMEVCPMQAIPAGQFCCNCVAIRHDPFRTDPGGIT